MRCCFHDGCRSGIGVGSTVSGISSWIPSMSWPVFQCIGRSGFANLSTYRRISSRTASGFFFCLAAGVVENFTALCIIFPGASTRIPFLFGRTQCNPVIAASSETVFPESCESIRQRLSLCRITAQGNTIASSKMPSSDQTAGNSQRIRFPWNANDHLVRWRQGVDVKQ